MTKELEFENPVFDWGYQNYTVRKGLKWKNLEISEEVRLIDARTKKFLGFGTVETLIICDLWTIPDIVLEREHDPRCREYESLLEILNQIYGDMKEEDVVTCIGFEPIEEDDDEE